MHNPVLYHQIISCLNPQSGMRFVDCTVGSGGHAWGLLDASKPDGLLLGLDVDPYAIEIAQRNLAEFGDRATLVQASYATLSKQLEDITWPDVDGILLDLGVSSMQLDNPERGFSFQKDAPLDMRFSPGQSMTAYQLVNELAENELANVIYWYGDERYARKIAHAIVEARPIETTGQLASLILQVIRIKRKGIHPATRTFQALRIEVNQELKNLEDTLPQAVKALKPNGKLAVIAFHSLEDRIVKEYFRRESRDCICPSKQPVCTCGHKASIEIITRRPIFPDDREISLNPRSRSARLRVAQKTHK
ncbi:MAG: 16S rRNA (cytosine(1402)-N(4))-methyltransferase RsmH [Anaerolineales bacterium]